MNRHTYVFWFILECIKTLSSMFMCDITTVVVLFPWSICLLIYIVQPVRRQDVDCLKFEGTSFQDNKYIILLRPFAIYFSDSTIIRELCHKHIVGLIEESSLFYEYMFEITFITYAISELRLLYLKWISTCMYRILSRIL